KSADSGSSVVTSIDSAAAPAMASAVAASVRSTCQRTRAPAAARRRSLFTAGSPAPTSTTVADARSRKTGRNRIGASYLKKKVYPIWDFSSGHKENVFSQFDHRWIVPAIRRPVARFRVLSPAAL